MKEFNYDLDYKLLDFTNAKTRKLYRIGRGEQGVLLVRPYTNIICAHWRFVNEKAALISSNKIYQMFCEYKQWKDFIGMDMARKFLEMGFTRARRYANRSSGRKYAEDGSIFRCEKDCLTNEKAKAAKIFKVKRDLSAYDDTYIVMRKQWRSHE